MWTFIAQYWIEFVFGLLIAGVGFLLKHHWKIFKETEKIKEQKFEEKINKQIEDMYEKSQRDDTEIMQRIEIITQGMLSLQGQMFRKKCRALLEMDEIPLSKYEQLIEDHDAYNKLNGNHKGDELFELVKQKVIAQGLIPPQK